MYNEHISSKKTNSNYISTLMDMYTYTYTYILY